MVAARCHQLISGTDAEPGFFVSFVRYWGLLA